MRSSVAALAVAALCACDTYRFYHDTAGGDAITDDGPTWEELAGSASGNGLNETGAADVTVSADASGNPAVAWSDSNGDINVRQWSGSAWIDLGFPNTPGPSSEARVAVDTLGRVVVAWTEGNPASGEIQAQRLDSGVWNDLGSVSATPTQQSFQPRLAAGAEPVVAWLELSGDYEIYAAHYDGAAWQPYGASANVSNNDFTDWSPAVGIGADDNPCVAWTDNEVRADLRLVCWNGLAWAALGDSLSAGGITPTSTQAWDASVAVDSSGQPWLAWRSDASSAWEAYLAHFDGGAWHPLGDSERVSPDPQSSDQAVMTLDHDGTPILAWTEVNGGGTAIYASTWDGAQWIGLAGSLTDGGVSGTGNMVRPSITASAAGYDCTGGASAADSPLRTGACRGPITLAWLAGTSDSPRVYVRRLR